MDEGQEIRDYLAAELGAPQRIGIDTAKDGIEVSLYTAEPDVVVGKRGERLSALQRGLARLLERPDVRIKVIESAEPSKPVRDSLMHCSFCGKSQKSVAKLIAGPGVYICDECVRLCDDILAEESPGKAPGMRPVDELTTEDAIAELTRAAENVRPLETHVQHVVANLRSRGVTWAVIGQALGMTRQGAWGRFSGEE